MTTLARGWQRWLAERLVRNLPAGFIRNLSWQYVSSGAAVVFGFLYSLLVGRELGAMHFGLLSLALGFATIVFQVVELRLHEAVIRYVAEFWEAGDHRRTVAALKLFVFADVITGLMALGLVLLAARWATHYLIRDDLGPLAVILAAFSVFFTNVATATALGLYRVFGDFKALALISSSGAALKLILALGVLYLSSWGVLGVMLAAVVSSVITNSTLIGYAFRRLRQRVPITFSDAPVALLADRRREMFGFIRSSYLLSLTMISTKELDINLLGYFAPLQTVGSYKIAKSFMSAIWTLSDSVFFVVYPDIARMWTKRRFVELRAFLKKITAGLGISALAVYALACLVLPPLIVALMGSDYQSAGSIFRWLSWGLVFWAPLVWVNPLLLAAGRADLLLKAAVVSGAIIALSYVPAIEFAGANGAAFVTALSNPVALFTAIWIGNRAGIIFPQPDESSGIADSGDSRNESGIPREL